MRIAIAALALLVCGLAHGQDTDSPNPERLLSKLHAVNQMEIKAGRLAQGKGQSAGVKEYGKDLVRDHMKADRKVMALARTEGLKLKAPPPDPEDQAAMKKMRESSGADFDQVFLDTMKAGHDKTIAMLEEARGQGPDVKLNKLIGDLLPELRKHDDMAEGLKH